MSESERLYHPQVVLPVRARIVVVPGETRFVFRSPGMGDDWGSNKFFETYDGREGLIVSYETQHQQYPSGVYLWSSFGSHGFYALFDGETSLQFVKSIFVELVGGFKLPEAAPGALAPDAKIAPPSRGGDVPQGGYRALCRRPLADAASCHRSIDR